MAKFETYASGAIWWRNMQLMQVAPPGAQNWNQCKLYYMLAKFGTNAGGATWWSNFELIQVEPHCNALAKFVINASGFLFS